MLVKACAPYRGCSGGVLSVSDELALPVGIDPAKAPPRVSVRAVPLQRLVRALAAVFHLRRKLPVMLLVEHPGLPYEREAVQTAHGNGIHRNNAGLTENTRRVRRNVCVCMCV